MAVRPQEFALSSENVDPPSKHWGSKVAHTEEWPSFFRTFDIRVEWSPIFITARLCMTANLVEANLADNDKSGAQELPLTRTRRLPPPAHPFPAGWS